MDSITQFSTKYFTGLIEFSTMMGFNRYNNNSKL